MKRSLLIAMLMLCPNTSFGQGIEHIKAHYTKYEYRIPMRDGKKLFTSVYVPKDESKKYPIMLTRTPYNVKPYGVDQYKSDLGPSPLFGKAGYIFVYQDVRGRWLSEGEFVNMRPIGVGNFDDSTDTFDTIDWLLKHVSGHNGKVGQWGVSYPGFYTVCGMINAHPALKAVSPQLKQKILGKLVEKVELLPEGMRIHFVVSASKIKRELDKTGPLFPASLRVNL